MKSIFDLSFGDLKTVINNYGTKSFVAKQIWSWIYSKGIRNFDDMNNISKKIIEDLSKEYSCARPNFIKDFKSEDGTRKWLIEFEDKKFVELVYIPSENRGTLCISSQIGCSMNCKFCNTGAQGLTRNLETYEIIQEIIFARDMLNDWENKAIGNGRKITNIVLMGMGEPLMNYNNVVKAIKIINDENGIAFSNRRITLSTCGIVPKIYDLANNLKINLAISLHATDNEIRKKIMPIAEKYTIDDLMKSCNNYAQKTNYRRITFEYVMIDNINDTIKDAEKLIKLVKYYNIPAKFNLIPFNPWQGCIFNKPSNNKRILEFAKYITDAHYPCPIRFSRGQDIMAACGQLKSNQDYV